jgi:hypothetical protein
MSTQSNSNTMAVFIVEEKLKIRFQIDSLNGSDVVFYRLLRNICLRKKGNF